MNFKREKFLLLGGLPSIVRTIAEKTNCYLIGGTVSCVFSSRAIHDYDFYFHTYEDFQSFKDALTAEDNRLIEWRSLPAKKKKGTVQPSSCKQMFVSENAESWLVNSTRVQLINYEKFLGSPEQIWHYFDFTVCMGAYSFKEDMFIFHDDFLAHNAQRRIVFNFTTEYPICSLIRVMKYVRYGYKINSLELVKVALAINALELSDYKAIKRQLMGIDTLFLKPLTDWLDGRLDIKFDLSEFMEKYQEVILNAYHIDPLEVDDDINDPVSNLTKNIINP